MRTTMMLTAMLAAQPAAAQEKAPKPLTTIDIAGEAKAVWWIGQKMAFTPSGKELVISYVRRNEVIQRVSVFDSATGKEIAGITARPKVNSEVPKVSPMPVAVDPKGEWVAYPQGDTIRYLVIPPHKPKLPAGAETKPKDNEYDGGSTGRMLTTDAVGDFVSYRAAENDVFATRRKFGGPVERSTTVLHHVGAVNAIDALIDPIPTRCVTSVRNDEFRDEEYFLYLWTVAETPTKRVIEQNMLAWSLAISPDGKLVAAGYPDGTVRWYDLDTGKLIHRTKELSKFSIIALAFHPTGKYLACGSTDQRGPDNLIFLDIAAQKVVKSLHPVAGGISNVCFDKAGKKFAVADHLGIVKIYDAADLLPLRKD